MPDASRRVGPAGERPPPVGPAVEINGLSYAYRGHEDRPVLREVDLTVSSGEFLVVTGRTGSGKTTLCLAMTGLIPKSFGGAFHGSVRVAGLDTRATEQPRLARVVGIVQQSPESQLIGLTVAEEVEFGLENLALPVTEIRARAGAALELVGLADHAERSPWRLSGGQKQRLAIASALAFQPRVLVLDNPTAELDPVGRAEVLRTLGALNRDHGVTVVMVAQDLYEVAPYAGRVVVLDQGRVAVHGPLAEVLQDVTRLRDLGVKVPDLTALAARLRDHGRWDAPMPATIDAAEKEIRRVGVPVTVGRPAPVPAPPAAADPLVRFEQVRYAYPGGREILRGVDLAINPGEFVAVMGANGAGKTTVGKHLNGLLRPSSGRVLVDGRDTRAHTVAQLATTVGYVFQNPDHQIVCRKVAEELALGPVNLGWPAERVAAAVERTLAFLGMSAAADADPFFLGLAERNLVALASALIVEPRLLVLDEPATGADHGVVRRLMERVAALHRDGLTIVMITHDAALVAEHATRLVVVADGRIVLDGPPAQVFDAGEELRACQVTPPPVVELAHRLADLGMPRATLRLADAVAALTTGAPGGRGAPGARGARHG